MSTEGTSQDEGQRKPSPSTTPSAGSTPTSASSEGGGGGGTSLRRLSGASKLSASAGVFVPKTFATPSLRVSGTDDAHYYLRLLCY